MHTWGRHECGGHHGCRAHLCQLDLHVHHVHRSYLDHGPLRCGLRGDLDGVHRRWASRGCLSSRLHGRGKLGLTSVPSVKQQSPSNGNPFATQLQLLKRIGPTSIAARKTSTPTAASCASTTLSSSSSPTSLTRCGSRCITLTVSCNWLIGYLCRWCWLLVRVLVAVITCGRRLARVLRRAVENRRTEELVKIL